MRTLNKKLLGEQIDVFLSWGNRAGMLSLDHKDYLEEFKRFTSKEDVLDITQDDVDLFVQFIYADSSSNYEAIRARKVVMSLQKFYMARGKNGNTRLGRGRPPALDQYKMVGEYKLKNKLSFRKIGILLNPRKPVDVSQVHKWFKRFMAMNNHK